MYKVSIRSTVASCVIALSLGMTSFAQTERAVILTEEMIGGPTGGMMQRHLDEKLYAAIEARKEKYDALKTPEDIKAYQVKMRNFFKTNIGGFPERTPLNAKIVGGATMPNYRYEKIIYESQPGYYVTAVLYLPKTKGPYPGVLFPCGHSAKGKAMPAYQRACISLAMNGFAVLCYDPVGQGERFYPYGSKKKAIGATTEHTLLNASAIPTGTNVSMYRIWDGMRSIDYMESRDDILTDKLGVTGNSGGGTLTSYLMALDERVYVAAVSCYLTDYKDLIEVFGPHDGEQNTFNAVAFGMNQPDLIHMHMPKPTLMMVATQDFFPIAGSWRTFREAKRLYTRMGFPEGVNLIEVDKGHGYHKESREGMVRWMKRWIIGVDKPVIEPEFDILSDAELQCTQSGNVAELPNAVSAFDLIRGRADVLAAERAKASKKPTVDEIRAVVVAQNFSVMNDAKKTKVSEDGNKQSWVLEPEKGIYLPLELHRPEGDVEAITIIVTEFGKKSVSTETIDALLKKGHAVCAVDLRGYGETVTSVTSMGPVGGDWCDYARAFLLGKSYVGMRSDDIGSTVRFVRSELGKDVKVALEAYNGATVPALHAAALNPNTFSTVQLTQGIPSWYSITGGPYIKHQLINAVHASLRLYDLPDLVEMIPKEQIVIKDSTIPLFEKG